MKQPSKPKCLIIAGPNGSGKTTFSQEFLAQELGIFHFVNVDLIAKGICPLNPHMARVTAGKAFLTQLDFLAQHQHNFAFETTLSGVTYLSRIQHWKTLGYHIHITFIKLQSPALALKRIESRILQGGHHVPTHEVIRRFHRGWKLFQSHYSHLADSYTIFDNSTDTLQLIKRHP